MHTDILGSLETDKKATQITFPKEGERGTGEQHQD
jgi:hypothetical protein